MIFLRMYNTIYIGFSSLVQVISQTAASANVVILFFGILAGWKGAAHLAHEQVAAAVLGAALIVRGARVCGMLARGLVFFFIFEQCVDHVLHPSLLGWRLRLRLNCQSLALLIKWTQQLKHGLN